MRELLMVSPPQFSFVPKPLSVEEIISQKDEFEQDVFDNMQRNEYTHRLQQDYFLWQR